MDSAGAIHKTLIHKQEYTLHNDFINVYVTCMWRLVILYIKKFRNKIEDS